MKNIVPGSITTGAFRKMITFMYFFKGCIGNEWVMDIACTIRALVTISLSGALLNLPFSRTST